MKDISINEETVNNIESPFTELFSLLKRYEKSATGLPTLAYNFNELKVIHRHIDNAVELLLQGLQGVGQLIGLAGSEKKLAEGLNQLGFFVSLITNLTEALNDLRSDTEYVLRQREVVN